MIVIHWGCPIMNDIILRELSLKETYIQCLITNYKMADRASLGSQL